MEDDVLSAEDLLTVVLVVSLIDYIINLEDELLKDIWMYKTFCRADLENPNGESKSAQFMEEVLKGLGISPKKNLGYEFFLGVRVFTDVQLGYLSPQKALCKLIMI